MPKTTGCLWPFKSTRQDNKYISAKQSGALMYCSDFLSLKRDICFQFWIYQDLNIFQLSHVSSTPSHDETLLNDCPDERFQVRNLIILYCTLDSILDRFLWVLLTKCKPHKVHWMQLESSLGKEGRLLCY